MATEADLIQKFKDLDIPVGADFEELIHAAFASANLADLVNNYGYRITTLENDLATKADDSKVVHDNHDGTEQLNGTKVQPFNKLSDSVSGRNLLIGSTDNIVHYDSVIGYTVWKSYVTQFNVGDTLNVSADITSNNGDTVLKVSLLSSKEIQIDYLEYHIPEGQTAHAFVSKTIPDETASILVRIDNGNDVGQTNICAVSHQFANTGSIATDWTPAPEDKADDSKVAHLSGANNFDTVPTVNSNPLLLASSLPSDLARTSQQTNFTAGLQSNGTAVATQTDVATAVNTATENMANMADLNNYYHANASDDAALASAKSATAPGIFWFEEV